MRANGFGAFPCPLQVVIGFMAYRSMNSRLYGQGTGRSSGEEISSFRKQIWESLNALLIELKLKSVERESPFWLLGGTEPSERDSVLFAFIVSVLVCKA